MIRLAEGTCFRQLAAGFGDIGALALEIIRDGAPQIGVDDVMCGIGGVRQVSARKLVLALSAGLDDLKPVLDREGRLAGMVSLRDLLSARARNLSEERDRERVIRIRLPFGSVAASDKTS